ncbi:MAG: hypothetical protein Q4Q07_06135 [Tissierellia bacterium]|nr:hypothetical protein [Tissierellia bacterium]
MSLLLLMILCTVITYYLVLKEMMGKKDSPWISLLGIGLFFYGYFRMLFMTFPKDPLNIALLLGGALILGGAYPWEKRNFLLSFYNFALFFFGILGMQMGIKTLNWTSDIIFFIPFGLVLLGYGIFLLAKRPWHNKEIYPITVMAILMVLSFAIRMDKVSYVEGKKLLSEPLYALTTEITENGHGGNKSQDNFRYKIFSYSKHHVLEKLDYDLMAMISKLDKNEVGFSWVMDESKVRSQFPSAYEMYEFKGLGEGLTK